MSAINDAGAEMCFSCTRPDCDGRCGVPWDRPEETEVLRILDMIEKERKRQGMKLYMLAEKCGVSSSSMSQYRAGISLPKVSVILAAFRALGIEVNYTRRDERPSATEAQVQQLIFAWAEYESAKYPELEDLFHIPNGGRRSAKEAHFLKLEGVKSGVPDLCLPVARGKYHALYIELKRESGGKVSGTQAEWLQRLREQGNCAEVCKGFEEARRLLLWYLEGAEDADR